jgi:beta-lactam-binding protein with PASTA domain
MMTEQRDPRFMPGPDADSGQAGPDMGDGRQGPGGGWSFPHGLALYLIIAEVVVGVAALVGIILVVTGALPARTSPASGPTAAIAAPTSALTPTYLDSAGVAGPDPFAGDMFAPLSPSVDVTSVQVLHGVGTAVQAGDTPGLYGGSMNRLVADKDRQLAFLQMHPGEAAAFCAALNSDSTLSWSGGNKVTVDQLPAYFEELTPVMLIHDTLVTNHGYKNGRATPRKAVLQAGQMVLVDSHGVPRVRCECGNPLAIGSPAADRTTFTINPIFMSSLLGVPSGLGNAGKTTGFGGLTPCTELVWNRLCSVFPAVANHFAGGLASRGNWTSDHPFGRAFDFGGPASLMQTSAAWLAQHYYDLNLKYIIHAAKKFKNGTWLDYTPPKALLASASYDTAYHFDHVHVSAKECAAYTGQQWDGFGADAPVQVLSSTQQISTFSLTDLSSGEMFERPAGTSGDRDVALHGGTTATTIPGGVMVTVPMVEGMDLEQAREELTMNGLKVTVTYEETTRAPAGRVLQQSPAAGQEISKDGFVELTVAKPPGTTTTTGTTSTTRPTSTTMPPSTTSSATIPARVRLRSLLGMNVGPATQWLVASNLRYEIEYVQTDDYPANTVTYQYPPADTQVAINSVVTLHVAQAVPGVQIPSLVGRSMDQATEILSAAGLKWTITPVYDTQSPENQVVWQKPSAGTKAPPNSTVGLGVAKIRRVTVPAVTGMIYSRAIALLAEYGLQTAVKYLETSDYSPNVVISQSPTAGIEAPVGSVVNLLVAAEPLVTVPSVVGMTEANAKATLVKYGLNYTVTYQANPKATPGYVIWQSPAADARVSRGTVVEIGVATPIIS